jgi:hypothetical protein
LSGQPRTCSAEVPGRRAADASGVWPNGEWTRDEARAWLPELTECIETLAEAQIEHGIMGVYAGPDPAYSQRINALARSSARLS